MSNTWKLCLYPWRVLVLIPGEHWSQLLESISPNPRIILDSIPEEYVQYLETVSLYPWRVLVPIPGEHWSQLLKSISLRPWRVSVPILG